MAPRWLDGGNKAAAPAVTTSSDSGRAQDWQQQEQLQQQQCRERASVQERGGEDWRSSALVSPHTRSSGAEARCCNQRGGAEHAHRSAVGKHQVLGWRRARMRREDAWQRR